MMDDKMVAELVSMSKKLKPGEMRIVNTRELKIEENGAVKKVVGQIIPQLTPRETLDKMFEKIDSPTIIPFTASYDGKEIIRGSFNQDIIQDKVKKSGKLVVVRDFFEKLVAKAKEEYYDLIEPEDELDYYIDEKGRTYEIVDGIRTYIDDRGFEYYLKYSVDLGKELSWTKMTNGSIGTFLDEDRTIIELEDGKAYYMDEFGKIDYSHEMPTIHHHR